MLGQPVGHIKWSLSLHPGLDARQYSPLLLACGSVAKDTNGTSSIACSEESWGGGSFDSMDYLMASKDTEKLQKEK